MRKHAYFSDFRKSSLARLLAHAPIFEYRRTSHIPSEMALEISNRYDYLNNSVVAVLQSVNTWIFVQNWCEWVENTSLTKPCLASVIQAKSPLTHPVARQYALLRIAGKRMIEASRVVKILWRHLTLSLGHPTLNTALYSSQWRVGLDDAGYLTPVLADTPFTGDVSVKHQRESVNLSCTKINV